jgi:hypothetical protein
MSSDEEEEEVPEKIGFMNNLTPEQEEALARKKAELVAKQIKHRERQALERAKAGAKEWKEERSRHRARVKGFKLAEENRICEGTDGWLYCEVCNKKFSDYDALDPHLTSDKHKNNLAYYAVNPLPDWSHEAQEWDPDSLPEFVQWRENDMMYNCTLCNKLAASEIVMQAHLDGKDHKKRLANREWYEEQSWKVTEETRSELPACVEWVQSEMRYICRWCDKRGDGIEQILIHLSSKEHAKKCSNLGFPQYGEAGHLERVKEFTDLYGFDIWARLQEWPDFIADTATCWNCTKCGKAYLTQVQVTEHLKERHSEAGEVLTRRPKAPAVAAPWSKKEVKCELCHVTFASEAELKQHEENDRIHKLVVGRLEAPLIDI